MGNHPNDNGHIDLRLQGFNHGELPVHSPARVGTSIRTVGSENWHKLVCHLVPTAVQSVSELRRNQKYSSGPGRNTSLMRDYAVILRHSSPSLHGPYIANL